MKYMRALYKIAYTLGVLALITSVLLNAGMGTALAASTEKDVEQDVAYSISVSPEDTHICDYAEGINYVDITVTGPPGATIGVKVTSYVVHPSSHPRNVSNPTVDFYRDVSLDGNGQFVITDYELYWPGLSEYDTVSSGDVVENHLSAELYLEDPDNPGSYYVHDYDDVDFYSYRDRCEPDPTPTPITPTPDPIDLSLQSVLCGFTQGQDGLMWQWRVNNPQDFDVEYDVLVGGVEVLSNQIASPGSSTFYLEKGGQDKTVTIRWVNEYDQNESTSTAQGWSYCMSLSDTCIDQQGYMTFTVNNWTPAEDMAYGSDPNNAPYDVYQNGNPAGALTAPLGESTFRMPSVPGSTVRIDFYRNQSKSITQSDEVCPYTYVYIYDPCEVSCDSDVVTSIISNLGTADADEITWEAFFNGGASAVATGTIESLPAGNSVNISFPSQGNGTYTIYVYDDGQQVSIATCEDTCQVPTEPPTKKTPTPTTVIIYYTPTPENELTPIPSPVPEEDEDPLLIPVTGLDYTPTRIASVFQNLGFGLLAVGMVLHGITLKRKDE